MALLFVFDGCQKKPPPPPSIDRVAAILRRMAINDLRHQDEVALKATIERMVETSKRIKSAADLERVGSGVSSREILDAAPRVQSLRNKFSGELNHLASNTDPSHSIDLGAAVVEAHCAGLKKRLATGKPSTAQDYAVYFVWDLVMSGIPEPSDKQIGEMVQNLARIEMELYVLTLNDEAGRRAYVKAMCRIP
jgi:hypothetical protein